LIKYRLIENIVARQPVTDNDRLEDVDVFWYLTHDEILIYKNVRKKSILRFFGLSRHMKGAFHDKKNEKNEKITRLTIVKQRLCPKQALE